MTGKSNLGKMSIYIPSTMIDQRPVKRLIELGRKCDRSANYLVVEAIIQYLTRSEVAGLKH